MDTSRLERIAEGLQHAGLTIAVAEADTAGYLGHLLCSVSGASRYFPGGVIAYGGDSKTRVLGVSPETLRSYGSVSRETAVAMARRARDLFGASLGLSATGVAGPTGGTPEKPPGTFWVALSVREGPDTAQEHRWNSTDRLANKERAAAAALELLEAYLQLA